MYAKFNRKIHTLRIAVTDRCNLRCTYCVAAEGITRIRPKDILSTREIIEVVEIAAGYGIEKVRITGGEPLVRKGIIDIVRQIATVPGINELSMTTNGTLLDLFAGELANAGLQRVNISLDTLNPERYREITKVGDVSSVISGIVAARVAGLTPIRINCVIQETESEKDALEVARYCMENDLEVRFIKENELRNANLSKVIYQNRFNCQLCNRLFMTADGHIKSCVHDDVHYNIRELGVEGALRKVLGSRSMPGLDTRVGELKEIDV